MVIVRNAEYFDGYFANGAFQLFNPLRRILDGQIPGADFFSFHGIGTIWLHVPIYVALGQDLAASEVSRYVVSGLAHAVLSIGLYIVLRSRLDRTSAVVLSLLFFAAAGLALDRVFFPQNSILGVRSAFPMAVALAIASGSWILSPVFLSAALIVAPEQGAAAVLSALAATALFSACRAERSSAKRLFVSVALAAPAYLLVTWLTSSGNLAATLKYAFVDIPADQFWYFGSTPNRFLPTSWRILSNWQFIAFFLLATFATLVVAWSVKTGSKYRVSSVFLLSYAFVSCVSQLGYLADANLQAALRAILLILIFAVASLRADKWMLALVALVLSTAMTVGLVSREALARAYPSIPDGQVTYLSSYWEQHLKALDSVANGQTIWSVYAGLPEASRGVFPKSFDYIIHALGPKHRAAYVEAFEREKPRVVRLDNGKTWVYGKWLVGSNWDVYRRVFEKYTLVHEDKMSTLWEPTSNRSVMATLPAIERISPLCFTAKDSGAGGVFDLNLSYGLTNPWSKIPIIGNTPRLLLSFYRSNDYGTTLPPPDVYGGQWAVPLVLNPDESVQICASAETFLPHVSMTLDRIEIRPAMITDSAKQYLLDLWNMT